MRTVLPLSFFLFFLLTVHAAAQRAEKPSVNALQAEAGIPASSILNAGNISLWVETDGQAGRSPGFDYGGIFPRGQGNILYLDGFVWGGRVFRDAARQLPAYNQRIRVGGASYVSGLKPGHVTGFGLTACLWGCGRIWILVHSLMTL